MIGRAALLALGMLAIVPAHAGPGGAAIDPERRAAARRLLDASGFRVRQAVQLDDNIEAARSRTLQSCIDRAVAGKPVNCPTSGTPLPADRRERALDALVEAAQTVYAETYTAAEMDQLTRFFQTDIGRKYDRATPVIITRVQAFRRRLLDNELRAAAAAGAGAKQ